MNNVDIGPGERVEEISPDLPYELQFQAFNQLTTLAAAGAGLAIPLAGSVLSGFSFPIWVSVACFTMASLSCLMAQRAGVAALFARKPSERKLGQYSLAAIFLMAIGIGALGSGVLPTSLHSAKAAATGAPATKR